VTVVAYPNIAGRVARPNSIGAAGDAVSDHRGDLPDHPGLAGLSQADRRNPIRDRGRACDAYAAVSGSRLQPLDGARASTAGNPSYRPNWLGYRNILNDQAVHVRAGHGGSTAFVPLFEVGRWGSLAVFSDGEALK